MSVIRSDVAFDVSDVLPSDSAETKAGLTATVIVDPEQLVSPPVVVIAIPGGTIELPKGSQEIGLGLILALILIFRAGGLTKGREIPFPFRSMRRTAGAAPPATAGAPVAERS